MCKEFINIFSEFIKLLIDETATVSEEHKLAWLLFKTNLIWYHVSSVIKQIVIHEQMQKFNLMQGRVSNNQQSFTHMLYYGFVTKLTKEDT